MGRGVGLLLIRSNVLGNEAFENRNGILLFLYKSKRQSINGKEADTYKIGTVANSTSTMHKLSSTPIIIDCFEIGDYEPYLKVFDGEPYNPDYNMADMWDSIINVCETLRQRYNETKDQRYWKELVRILPQGWLQTRTFTCNYEVLRNIYIQRQHHRLIEWHQFCDWIKTLPYSSDLILYGIE